MGLKVGDKFPAAALSKLGVKGKKAVVFFYGSDNGPSCKKHIQAFRNSNRAFRENGFVVIGVRNAAGVKGEDSDARVKLVVDEDDAIRKEVGIATDRLVMGSLPGRETFVLDSTGTIKERHRDQFDADSHVNAAVAALVGMPNKKSFSFSLR
jgi:peroxiredoxin Q/BCP